MRAMNALDRSATRHLVPDTSAEVRSVVNGRKCPPAASAMRTALPAAENLGREPVGIDPDDAGQEGGE